MKSFEYAAPRSETEALEVLSAEPGRTEILAGGTDLIGLLKKMVLTPDRVVNIMGIPSLRQIERLPDGGVSIGAAVTLDELLDSRILDDYPAIEQAIRGISSMQLQCQGTLGGEICQRPQCWFFRDGHGLLARAGTAVEAGDNRFHAIFGNQGAAKFVSSSRIAPALVAIGAFARMFGPVGQGETFVPIDQLFRVPRHEGQRETMLAPNQLLTHFVLPPGTGRFSATYEVRQGAGPEFPLAAAAASLALEGGVIRDARIVLGQVAPIPWQSPEAAALVVGRSMSVELAEAAGDAAVASATPLSQNGYKVQLAKVAVKRALLMAAGLPTGGF